MRSGGWKSPRAPFVHLHIFFWELQDIFIIPFHIFLINIWIKRYGQRSSSFSNNQFNELLWDSTFSSFTGSHIHRFSTFYLLGLEVTALQQASFSKFLFFLSREASGFIILFTSIFTFFFFGEIRNLTTLCLLNNNGFSLSSFSLSSLSFLWIGAQFPQEKFLSYGRILTLYHYFLQRYGYSPEEEVKEFMLESDH